MVTLGSPNSSLWPIATAAVAIMRKSISVVEKCCCGPRGPYSSLHMTQTSFFPFPPKILCLKPRQCLGSMAVIVCLLVVLGETGRFRHYIHIFCCWREGIESLFYVPHIGKIRNWNLVFGPNNFNQQILIEQLLYILCRPLGMSCWTKVNMVSTLRKFIV